jgi:hypothetical protein
VFILDQFLGISGFFSLSNAGTSAKVAVIGRLLGQMLRQMLAFNRKARPKLPDNREIPRLKQRHSAGWTLGAGRAFVCSAATGI